MDIVQIVFSPTGGTQKTTDMLTDGLRSGLTDLSSNIDRSAKEVKIKRIDLSDSELDFNTVIIREEDLVLIAVPSFAGRVPGLAAERLVKLCGNQAKCVLVCVYGNRAYEDTLVELFDLAVHCGFQVVAAVAAIAEHSIVHRYAAGRPDAADNAVLCQMAGQIVEKIKAAESSSVLVTIPGNRPYKQAGAASLLPATDEGCIECGRCAIACPAQAISLEDFRTTDASKCISCMRCVEECPMSARVIDSKKAEVLSERLKAVCSVRKENELFIG